MSSATAVDVAQPRLAFPLASLASRMAELQSAVLHGLELGFEEVEVELCPRTTSTEADCSCSRFLEAATAFAGANSSAGLAKLGLSVGDTERDRVLLELGHSTDSVNCSGNRGHQFETREVLERALVALGATADTRENCSLVASDNSDRDRVLAVVGPGAGNREVVGVNAELLAYTRWDVSGKDGKLSATGNASYAGKVDEAEKYVQVPYDTTRLGVLANLMVAQQGREAGTQPSPSSDHTVLRFRAARRRAGLADDLAKMGVDEFIRAGLREKLQDAASEEGRVVGLGGVFRITSGTVSAHVMSDFPSGDIQTNEDKAAFLKFYDVRATVSRPLHCACVITSRDKDDLRLRPCHTHFCTAEIDDVESGQDACMGHLHEDVADSRGQPVVYEGVLLPAANYVRFHPPALRQS